MHKTEYAINCMSRSGGEKGLRGRGAGTLGVPLGGTRRVGGLLGVAGRLSGPNSSLFRFVKSSFSCTPLGVKGRSSIDTHPVFKSGSSTYLLSS